MGLYCLEMIYVTHYSTSHYYESFNGFKSYQCFQYFGFVEENSDRMIDHTGTPTLFHHKTTEEFLKLCLRAVTSILWKLHLKLS